jgi:Domain of unknown function (DUF1707)/Cell wall-active antibiotics response 4TMS YvqF
VFRVRLEIRSASVKAGYLRGVSPRPAPRDLRASDADRERVIVALAEAASDGRLTMDEHAQRVEQAYAARTLGDLAVLTSDLAAPGAQPLRLDSSRVVSAFFSRERRDGRWVVPDRLAVTAVAGQVVLDLREALLQGGRTIVYATAIGGQVHLLVPSGVAVVVTSLSGRPGAGASPPPPAPGVPVIEVRTFAVAGRVHVRTPHPRRRGGWFPRRTR